MRDRKARFGGLFVRALVAAGAATALLGTAPARAQDYEREARWAADTLATLIEGEAVRIAQPGGHRFLALYTRAKRGAPRGAVIVAHGRGWAPDVDLYGELRGRLADAGWSTLSIQLPVLPGTAKIGDYVDIFPDSRERFAVAVDWLRAKGYAHIGIVSHSLGATMANDYLIRTTDGKVGAWVFISILNGLEDMFRLRIPVLDVYAEDDWNVIVTGADERRRQIERVNGSAQVMIKGARHFFDGRRDELTAVIAGFLERAFALR